MTTYIAQIRKIQNKRACYMIFTGELKMNNIEAINHYKHGITHDIFSEPVISYAKLAIEALEKQIPKRPVYDLTYKVNCCPCCDSPFTFYGAYRTFKSETNFCPYCGQAIDWSE